MRKFDVVLLKNNINIKFLGEHLQSLDNRPCVIISNKKNNTHCPNVNIIPLTTQLQKILPCHALLKSTKRLSYAMCEQPLTIDKKFIERVDHHLSQNDCENIKKALAIQLLEE